MKKVCVFILLLVGGFDLGALPSASTLSKDDKAEIAALPIPEQRKHIFNFPLRILSDSNVDVSTDAALTAQLSKLDLYQLISSEHRSRVFQTVKSLLPLIPDIMKYIQEVLKHEVVSIIFYGSYLWGFEPRDLDVLVVVNKRILTIHEIQDLDTLLSKETKLEKNVKKVSFHIIGQEVLKNNVDPYIPADVLFDKPGLMINSYRTRGNKTLLVLWGKKFILTPHQVENNLADMSRLLISVYQRMNNTFYKKKTEDEHFRKSAKRMSVVATVLSRIQGKWVLPREKRESLSVIGITDHPSSDQKRLIVSVYRDVFNAYQKIIQKVEQGEITNMAPMEDLIKEERNDLSLNK